MFLSKLVLNARDRQARYDLARPYEMHRTLMNGYPYARVEHRCDLLFRVETSRFGPPSVLVQTRDAPDWSGLPAGYLLGTAEWKPFDLAVAAGQRLRFRLRANPTKKVGSSSKEERLAGHKKNGRRVARLGEGEQVAWLLRKGEGGGFRVPAGWLEPAGGRKRPSYQLDVVEEGCVPCGKEGHTGGQFHAVRFEGVLEVTDPVRLRVTVEEGIGSAKSFGFGLLSLAPERRGEP
jgi:CRISPR system Cascade subunit CasE